MNSTIITLFEEQVKKTPEAIAVYLDDEFVTYEAFNKKVNQYARMLRQQGIGPNVIVAIEIERSYEILLATFAVLKAGGCYLPLATEHPVARNRHILKDGDVKWLIINKVSLDVQPYENCLSLCIHQDVSNEDESNCTNLNAPEDLCYVMYTSGSTGEPKGVMIQHRALLNRIVWMNQTFPLTKKDVLFQKTHSCFDVSVWELIWWSTAGAGVALLPKGRENDIRLIIKFIEHYRISIIHFVPSVFRIFLDYIKRDFSLGQLESLRIIFSSGEILDCSSVERFNFIFKDRLHPRLINLYGPTEATIDVSYFECDRSLKINTIPIGKAINNISLFVLDESLNPVPEGESGELYISGVGVSSGYLNKSKLTSSSFIANPLSSGKIMYKTGDQVKHDSDGQLIFLGRYDDQIKLRGLRIELKEIEHSLRGFPHTQDVHVTYATFGHEKNILAFVISRDNSPTIDSSHLKSYLAEILPGYMVPSLFLFIDRFPLKQNGKVDSKRLVESLSFQTETITSLLEKQVKRTPDACSVILEDDSVTFEQLNKRANQLARLIKKKGGKQGDFVLLYYDRCIDMIVAILAVLKAGAAYVPIDIASPEDRVRFIQKDTASRLLLTKDHLKLDLFSNTKDCHILSSDDPIVFMQDDTNFSSFTLSSDCAYLIYTSGTTGEPKGVIVEHHSVVNLVKNQIKLLLPLTQKPMNCLQYSSLAFDVHVWEIFFSLCTGQTLVLATETQRKDTYFLKKLLQEMSVDIATIPPVLLRTDIDCALSLTVLTLGGEITENKIQDYYHSRGVQVINAYGPTEATVCTSFKLYDGDDSNDIGQALDNVKYYVLDENLEQLPIGEVGNLYISGSCLARGYLNKPQLNEESFIENVFESNDGSVFDRLYKTGDRAFFRNATNIVFVGRSDFQVKINGVRIELTEIEQVLLTHPGCQQCVVEADSKSLLVYYCSDSDIKKDQLKDFLKSKLPSYMPSVSFTKLSSMPLNINGKIDRAKLSNTTDLLEEGAKNCSELEVVLRETLEEFIVCKSINANDNFFELGINSIDVPIICRKLSGLLGRRIDMLSFYHHPSLAELCQMIKNEAIDLV